MSLTQIYYIAEIVVGIAFVISVVFLALQVRQNSKIISRTYSMGWRRKEDWYAERIATDPDFRDFIQRIDREYDKFTVDEKFRADVLASGSLRLLLDGMIAYTEGNMSESDWLTLEPLLERVARKPNFNSVWTNIKNNYPEDIQIKFEAMRDGSAEQIKLLGH